MNFHRLNPATTTLHTSIRDAIRAVSDARAAQTEAMLLALFHRLHAQAELPYDSDTMPTVTYDKAADAAVLEWDRPANYLRCAVRGWPRRPPWFEVNDFPDPTMVWAAHALANMPDSLLYCTKSRVIRPFGTLNPEPRTPSTQNDQNPMDRSHLEPRHRMHAHRRGLPQLLRRTPDRDSAAQCAEVQGSGRHAARRPALDERAVATTNTLSRIDAI